MIIEPIKIILDRERNIAFPLGALMRAEHEINRRRGARPSEFVSIDYLMLKAAQDALLVESTGAFPLDLMTVMLWSGLYDDDSRLTVDAVIDMMATTETPRGEILMAVWSAYKLWTRRESKAEEAKQPTEGRDPLAPRPGETSGVLQ